MAKKGFEILRPNHEEYIENFMALSSELREPDEIMIHASGLPREMIFQQVDHLLDKHALDYPEILTEYIVARELSKLALEAV